MSGWIQATMQQNTTNHLEKKKDDKYFSIYGCIATTVKYSIHDKAVSK